MSRFFVLNYILSIASLGLTIYGFAANVPVGFIGLVIGIAVIVITYVAWYRAVHGYYVRPLEPVNARNVKISQVMLNSGYELIPRRGTPGDALITSARINNALFNEATGKLIINSGTFRAKHPAEVGQPLLREFTRKKNIVLFNGKKVRLASEPLLNENGALSPTHIQPTHYYDTLVTNDALGVSLWSNSNKAKFFDGHEFCLPGKVIPECSLSACANQIGASTIALTADNYLVVVGQANPSAFSQRLWAPSGSGSADWKDVGKITDLQQFVQLFASRELREECGLEAQDITWIRTLGYGRLLHRGGLPQFFCLAKLNCTFDKVRITRSERPLVDYHLPIEYGRDRSRRESIEAVVKELRKNNVVLSSVLWWCFELLSRLPDEDLEIALP
jgi:hypothetical protein